MPGCGRRTAINRSAKRKMKLQRRLAIAAGSAFTLSYFLPALGTRSGFSCLSVCWGIFTRSDVEDNVRLGGWLYYSGFVAANALFVILLGAIFLETPCARLRLWASVISMLQVLSWLILNLVYVGQGDRFPLRAGYFIWLLSFILLFCAQISSRRMPSRSLDPRSASVTPPAGHEPNNP